MLTILLPALLGGGAAEPLPRTPSTVTIVPPIAIAGRDSFTLASWQVMLALAFLVPALVVGAGLTLGLVSILASRFINRTKSTPDFQQSAAAVEKRRAERVARMRAVSYTHLTLPTSDLV